VITIPQYFKIYIDNDIDLDSTSSICCPFHKEDTPSFSYSKEKGIWRCWGACGIGGDVLALHMAHYHIKNREDGKKSLNSLLGIYDADNKRTSFVINKPLINNQLVAYNTLLYKVNSIVTRSKNPDKYIELDIVMSRDDDVNIIDKLNEVLLKCQ